MNMFRRSSIRGLCSSAAAILACVGSVAPAYACDCSDPPLQWIEAHADVIFRGTLVALPPATGPQGFGDTFDTGKIAVFHVSRVWKGSVGPALEMPALLETSACWGFGSSHLRIGNDLLVFAFRVPSETTTASILETTICSHTAPAKGNRDLEELGLGYAPTVSSTKPAKIYFASVVFIVGIAAIGAYMVLRRKHGVVSDNHRKTAISESCRAGSCAPGPSFQKARFISPNASAFSPTPLVNVARLGRSSISA
jgi:hypothetical protein